MYSNQAHDRYNAGADVTVTASTDVKGRTFATITEHTRGELPAATTASPGSSIAGVFKYDATQGQNVGLARGASRVLTVAITGELTPGQEVQIGTGGTATALSDGRPVGYVHELIDESTAFISLYQ